MATFVRRLLPSRELLVRSAMWACGVAGAIGLVFSVTTGAASLFFLAFAAFFFVRYRSNVEPAAPIVIGCAALGLFGSAIPYPPLQSAADGFVALAIVAVGITLLIDAVPSSVPKAVAYGRTLSSVFGRGVASVVRWIASITWPRWDQLTRLSISAALAIALAVSVGAAYTHEGWRLIGAHAGAPVWNAAFFEGTLASEGTTLRDARFIGAGGAAPRVGIADSPALTAVKLEHPGPLDGARIANAVTLLNVALTLAGAVWLITLLANSLEGALAAVLVAFALSPLLLQERASAPFDLWPALLVASAACARRSPLLLAVFATAAAFLNCANGYETAVLLVLLSLTGRVRRAPAFAVAASAFAASVVASAASRSIAPDVATMPEWWSTNDLVQLMRATDILWSPSIAVPCALAIGIAWFSCIRARDRAPRIAFVPLAGALLMALPAMLGGVPLLVPAAVLDLLPLGWPSARMLELATLFAVVPIAVIVRWTIARTPVELRKGERAIAVSCFAFCALALSWPTAPLVVIPRVPQGETTVELPVAQAGSRDAALFSAELLQRDVKIAQPVPFLRTDALVPSTRDPEVAIAALASLHAPAAIVVRDDAFQRPSDFYARPSLLTAADLTIPSLEYDRHLSLSTITEEASVYALRSSP